MGWLAHLPLVRGRGVSPARSSPGSRVYEKFYKLLKQSKASKQKVYEKFYKLLKQAIEAQAPVFIKSFINF